MDTTRLQTLDRGLTVLGLVADSAHGLSVADIAARLGVARAIAYRIVATLADHAMVHRTPEGTVRLGSGPLLLAAQFEHGLRTLARPVIERLSAEISATAFLSVAHGEECVAVATAECDTRFVNVGYRTGRRHPISVGAAGIAILAARPERVEDLEAVRTARRDGYSVTHGQLQPGAIGVAAPVRLSPRMHPGLEASLGVVAMQDLDVDAAAAATRAAAETLSRLMHADRAEPD